jgi:hypothetical protein
MKSKPIYAVYMCNKNVPYGMQPVKANNAKEAKEKFKKRFPKSRFLSASKLVNPEYIFISQAI